MRRKYFDDVRIENDVAAEGEVSSAPTKVPIDVASCPGANTDHEREKRRREDDEQQHGEESKRLRVPAPLMFSGRVRMCGSKRPV